MLPKDYAVLIISLLALGVSLFNFYVQHFRRHVKLIGSLISMGIFEGEWDTKVEYVLSNVGDVQLVVKELEFIVEGEIKNNIYVAGLPKVLKPGEVTLVDFFYSREDTQKGATEIVEFGIFSSHGKGYRLPHTHSEKGRPSKTTWEAFELRAEHERF